VYIFDSFVLKNTHNHTRKNVRQLLSLQFFTKAQAKANQVKLFRRHHASDPRWESKKKMVEAYDRLRGFVERYGFITKEIDWGLGVGQQGRSNRLNASLKRMRGQMGNLLRLPQRTKLLI
jgi:hypothetical protein